MSVKKVVFNDSTGMVFVESSDGSTNKFNIADTVTATTSPGGGIASRRRGTENFVVGTSGACINLTHRVFIGLGFALRINTR